MRIVLSSLAALALAGCATALDPNYAMQMQAYTDTVRAQQAVELAKANAEAARYAAMSAIARDSDAGTRNMALVALAMSGRGGGAGGNVNVVLPQAPERQEDRAYKWAALFAAPVATLVQGYFGYRTAINSSDNNRETSIASYNAFSNVAGAGFASNVGIANAGFGAAQGIAASGFGAIGSLRPPQPNVITISGTGVIAGRDGSYVGPNSGSNSGNSGHIGNQDRTDSPDNPPPVTVPGP
jgi:hypothetical protein